MDTKKLQASILAALDEYCDAEEVYGDNAHIEINPAECTARIVTDEEADESAFDCYPVLELLRPDPADASRWAPDAAAVELLLDEE